MQTILPGKPQATLHAVDYGYHEGQLVVAYISGSALVILNGPHSILQTIYHDDAGPEGLQCVAYHQATGKIATASGGLVYIHGLREEIKGTLRWTLDLTLPLQNKQDTIRTLTWGSDEELLVGSNCLTLFSAHISSNPSSPTISIHAKTDRRPIWTRPLPSPIGHAAFSPSASLIATRSLYGCLVKIWRRLSFESPIFDYTYLKHPDTVTYLEWRRARNGEDNPSREDDVLYTICADGIFRIWTMNHAHSIDILTLYAEIDMIGTIQPKSPISKEQQTQRFAFMIEAGTLDDAVDGIVSKETKGDGKNNHAVEYLKEVASRKPDMFVFVDGQGHMSAWGVENVACKRRNSGPQSTQPFHVSQVEGISFGFEAVAGGIKGNARMLSLAPPSEKGEIAILVHHFDGRLQWWQDTVQNLLEPSANKHRMRKLADWTGHSDSIKKVIRTASGKALISRTDNNEGIVWVQSTTSSGTSLKRKSQVSLAEHIHRTVLLREGRFLVMLHHNSISLWDARHDQAVEIGRCKYSIKGKPLCLLVLPEADADSGKLHLATVSAEMQGIVWELTLPHIHVQTPTLANGSHAQESVREFCTFQLEHIENLSYMLPVDPAGSLAVASGFLDSFAQDIAFSYTTSGHIQTWTAKVDTERQAVEWFTTARLETGVDEPALGSATSIRRAALVDATRSTFTIWDTRSGRLDYEETFPNQRIQDLDWASTPDGQSILAVGFAHRALVYTQLRYDYVNERPSWARIKDVSIRDLTPHPIGDSVWLRDGNLVVCAGNQLFMASDQVDLQKDISPELQSSIPHKRAQHIHDVVHRMNGPLAVFHPQFISQCVLAGKLEVVHRILLILHKTLKFYTEGDELDPLQGTDVEDFLDGIDHSSAPASGNLHRSHAPNGMDEESSVVTEDIADSLTSLLSEKSIPQLTGAEQLSLADIVECVATVEKHRRSIDDNAARFLLFWREAVIHSHQPAKGLVKRRNTASVSWREIVWAHYSSSQDILVDLVSRHHKGKIQWADARDSGMFMWLSDREALMAQFEIIARNAYSLEEPRNPVDCSLFYLALHKKAVLIGLWRMATWSREQAATMRLLRNDFTDHRWKTAAAKNAYALMGKRRFEYAAAFFLLADDLASAVSVLSNQLDDMQLAIAVARVYGGDDCPALKNLLEKKLLPLAAAENNRWQSSWCYWLLGQRANAVRALVSPLHTLLSPPGSPPESTQARSFLNDDPALVILYRQLREKSLQTLRGATMITGPEEWGFVMRTASLLRRMGCDVLALDLVRNWEFLKQYYQPRISREEAEEGEETVGELASPKETRSALDDYDFDPRKLLRRRSSLVVADMPPSSPGLPKQQQHVALPSMLDGYGIGGDDFAPKKAVSESNGKDVEAKKATQETLEEKKKPPPPTAFKEPDANSLLDSFGF